MLLNTVKDVCGSLLGLLIHAKNANGQELEHPAFVEVSDYSKVSIIVVTITIITIIIAGRYCQHYQPVEICKII